MFSWLPMKKTLVVRSRTSTSERLPYEWTSLSVRTTMIAGASNSDSDFLDGVVTLMRSSSSRLSVAKSIGESSWRWA
jgi:hypothetical protein